MNAGHLHLILNHAPIFGAFVGMIIFGFGMFRRNNTLEKTGLITFIVTGIATLPTYFTGEAAEEVAERFKDSSHDMIHEHEEAAEGFIFGIWTLTAVALVGFALLLLNHAKAKLFAWIVLIYAVVVSTGGMWVGYLGGQISQS